jgi:thiol-disulfide isomerase/thioredoxin
MIGSHTGTVVAVLALVTQAVSGQESAGIKPRLDEIVKAHGEARECFIKELEANMAERGGTMTAEDRRPADDRYLAEVARNTGTVLELVRANPDDPSIVEALKFVIKTAGRGPGDESYRAMELLRGHVADPGMGELSGLLFHFVHVDVAESILRGVLETNPDRAARGLACQSLSEYLGYRARMVRRIREKPARIDEYVHERHKVATERLVREADAKALDRESEALLERIVAEFADVKDWFTPGRTIGAIAEGKLFATRNLSVGNVAPEIRGRDHEGRSFSSSDSRGKVVVLTFSAGWCGPCVGMYPQLRELVEKFKAEPFVLVSVNADTEVETLKESIDSGKVTWRCWWDGGMDGPITTRWGVISIPSIFVLDKAGMIRFKDVRGPALDDAVASLLEEAAAGSSSDVSM